MSLERDIAHAFTTLGDRLTSIETCLVQLSRDSAQQSDWRHEQRNHEQAAKLFREETSKNIRQIQIWMGSFSDKLTELVEALRVVRAVRHEDVRRINALERRPTPAPELAIEDEELTKP
jgi:hypothetical protein